MHGGLCVKTEVIGNATLYLGDCREILPTLPNVDAVVTDPPYGIGFKYASHDDSADGYGNFIWSIISAAEALCRPSSPVFVWQAQTNFKKFSQWFPRDWRILIEARNFVQMRSHVMQFAYSPVLTWWTPGDGKPWREPKDSGKWVNRDWFIANSAAAVSDTTSLARQHPCPRQVDAMEFVIGNWVRPMSLALDPFMGSGTTGVACANLGRNFIGIEIEPKYFDIACKRIDAAYAQGRLFA
jgi:DNA modification methylase